MSRSNKKPYTKSKAFDKTCRCNGGCSYCLGNRMHSQNKRIDELDYSVNHYNKNYMDYIAMDNDDDEIEKWYEDNKYYDCIPDNDHKALSYLTP